MSVACKTFDSYIKELIYYPKRAPKWLSDKRLTQLEKRILQGHLLIRENKNAKVIEELKNVSKIDIDFVKDHYHLLLGICYNNTGNYSQSERLLILATKGFEERSEYYHLFTSLFNLLMIYSNRGKVPEMATTLKRMEEICPDATITQIRLLRCQFVYAVDSNDKVTANKLIDKINKVKSDFSESDLGEHFICEFMFHIKHEKFDKAQSIIEEMKKYRNYTSTDNFNFMKELLAHLRVDKTLYVYDREFPNKSVLYQQMKVIEAMQSSHQEEAQKWWKELQLGDSHLYGDNFHYRGEKCLFSLCLDKHLKKEKTPDSFKLIKGDRPKIEVVYDILKSEIPVRKELLYELVYGETAEAKEDFIKLANLVSKVRSHYGLTIQLRKGAYILENSKKERIRLKISK